ncbi:MAG: hypothetical protein FWC68_01215 [Oscillospiraceae bacterium]|nr:hypothetical protein [Oscillospiraceae bacterium]
MKVIWVTTIGGRVSSEKNTADIEIRVPENSHGFPLYIWNNNADRFSVSVRSPGGEIIARLPAKTGTRLETRLILERSVVKIRYAFPMSGSGSQLSIVDIVDPTPGIWTITVHGDIVLDGTYNAWLPITGLVTKGVEFLVTTPDNTIVIPATSLGTITCGAYNSMTNGIHINSSWGPTRVPTMGVDITAPGVDVLRFISKKQWNNDWYE